VSDVHPLVDEAMKKAAIAWLSVRSGRTDEDRPPRTSGRTARANAVWCLWADGALYLVSGPGEQPAPDLASSAAVEVTVRGDHGGRILTWPASVRRVEPGSEEWDRVAPQLAGKRLNARGTAEETVARWAAECVVSCLTPVGTPSAAGPSLPDGSGAAPPPPTPAARRTANPFRLHRVRRSDGRSR
jgi:hypothetical protein